jgi:hypothetical protein
MPQPKTKRRKNKKRTTIRKKRGGSVITSTRETKDKKYISSKLDVRNSNPDNALILSEFVTNVKSKVNLFPSLEQGNHIFKSLSGIQDTNINRTEARIVVNGEAESQQQQLFADINIAEIQKMIAEQSSSTGASSTGASSTVGQIDGVFNSLRNIISKQSNMIQTFEEEITKLQKNITDKYSSTNSNPNEASSTGDSSTAPNSTAPNSTAPNFNDQIDVLYQIKTGKLPTDYAQFTEYSKTIPKLDKTKPNTTTASSPHPSFMDLLPDVYKNIPDAVVEQIMDPLVSKGFDEIYTKGDPTTYDNVRWTIVLKALYNKEEEDKKTAEDEKRKAEEDEKINN